MQAFVKVYIDALHKTAITFLYYTNLNQKKKFQDNWPDLLHHNSKFHSDQFKSVWANEPIKFCFVLALWPPAKVKVTESDINH